MVMFSSYAVIGSVFCHSWGHYVTAESTGRAIKFKPLGCCHRFTLEVPIQHDFRCFQNNWKLGTGKSQTSVISRQLGTLGGERKYVVNGHPNLNSKLGTLASF